MLGKRTRPCALAGSRRLYMMDIRHRIVPGEWRGLVLT